MFEKIAVALDGSELAEVAIPHGEELASRLGSELILFHVCNPGNRQYHHMHQLYLEKMGDTVRKQLRKSRARAGEVKVSAEALVGEPVETICDYIEKGDIGLMIMAASGASGLKLWMLGSVADKVFRTCASPAMLVREELPKGKGKRINRILVPLDGSEASKIAVPYAEELALKLKASITLFQMAERVLPFVPMAPQVEADFTKLNVTEKKRARDNVVSIEKELRGKGIPVTHSVTSGDDPATAIIEVGKQVGADLVVMSTRGQSPITRWVLGSTAEKVLRQGELPLILVRRKAS